jgi:mannose-6-phosphate isomerase-like protein (cupin superfamily)
MVIRRDNAIHTQWGVGCHAWTLLQSADVIVKEESMLPGSEEHMHVHAQTQQFFYILEGSAQFTLNGEQLSLPINCGIFVRAGSTHMIANRSSLPIRFLVISFPGNTYDRINLD